MEEYQTLSLEQLEKVIDGYIREHNAAMIYWHHNLNNWDYLLHSDRTLFKQEMKNLTKYLKNGKIVHVTKGLVVDVKGTPLYPVEIEFEDVQCPSYFLVAKRGLSHHLDMTPYFFRSEKKRDEIFDFLKQGLDKRGMEK